MNNTFRTNVNIAAHQRLKWQFVGKMPLKIYLRDSEHWSIMVECFSEVTLEWVAVGDKKGTSVENVQFNQKTLVFPSINLLPTAVNIV